MTDLAKTQAEVNKLMREFGAYLAEIKVNEEIARRYEKRGLRRTQFIEQNLVPTASTVPLSAFTLTGGTIEYGTHTDEDGLIYVRVADETPGAAQAQVTLLRATGGAAGDEIAEGDGGDGTTITLTERNSTGLTFTVNIGTVTASETTDNLRLFVQQDAAIRAQVLFDLTEESHATLRDSWDAALDSALSGAESARDAWVAAASEFVRTRWAEFWQAASSDGEVPVIQEPDIKLGGVVDTRTSGLLELGRRNMLDNTPTQTVVENVVSTSTPAADANNTGAGTFAITTTEEWASAGLITFEVTDDTIGRERLSVQLRRTRDGAVLRALTEMTVKKQWSDPIIGLVDVDYSRTLELEAGLAADFADPPNDWTIDGETSANTDDGKVYLEIEESTGGGTFRINGYRSSTLIDNNLVFRTAFGAASASVAITSGTFTGTLLLGAGPTDTNTGTLDFQPLRVEGTNGRPDVYTATVTVTSRGEIQQVMADEFNFALNSTTSGGETIDEGYARAGGLPAHSVKDVW